jgi:cyclic beta-1,2-glucan synthetase
MNDFAPLCDRRGRGDLAQRYRGEVRWLTGMLELAWDGDWYRRAYFDDGTPLGSVQNDECKLDSLTQSWAVLAGTAQPQRAQQAVNAVRTHLMRRDAQIVLLLTPPFDRMTHDPGYIKGYLPGVRENGAQYTHAALWAVLATALRGDGNRALTLYQMLNPFMHARTPTEVATYKVEPYVVAADVYTAASHVGRGGWTWYTGSASWLYRVGLEGILGLRKEADLLFVDPRAPAAWPEYTIEYRHGRSLYVIVISNPEGAPRGPVTVTVDGRARPDGSIPLVDDGARHAVEVRPRSPYSYPAQDADRARTSS